MSTRKYRVVWRSVNGYSRGVSFPGPLTHKQAVTCKSKLTPRSERLDMLEEIGTEIPCEGEHRMVFHKGELHCTVCGIVEPDTV